MILRAKYVLPMVEPPIPDGVVAIAADRITAVGPAQELLRNGADEVRDLGDVVLLPGLINAHCHLDYTGMLHEVEWRGSFIEWVLQLVALKKLRTAKRYLADIMDGLELLLRSGTTTVVNVASFPELIDPIEDARANRPVGGLRVIWCLELLDFNRPAPVEELMREAEAFVDSRPRLTGRYGFSPHAPYSTSSGLYLAAARAAKARGVPLVTHVAESTEEDDMFRRGTGPMYDYFLRAGRDMRDCKRVGVVQMLDEAGVLGPHCLAAHANCLTPMDVQKLQSTHTNVVLCPHTHRFFGRGQPMLEAWWAAGINVCLGSDSLASNEKLDLLAEMQTLSHMFPRIAPERVLRMATLDAAAALPDGHRLGRLAPEATADLIALPLGEETVDPYESVVFAEGGVCFSMVEGKVLIG